MDFRPFHFLSQIFLRNSHTFSLDKNWRHISCLVEKGGGNIKSSNFGNVSCYIKPMSGCVGLI